MKFKNSNKTIAAFVAQEIKVAQQLEVKGGTGEITSKQGFIGADDAVII